MIAGLRSSCVFAGSPCELLVAGPDGFNTTVCRQMLSHRDCPTLQVNCRSELPRRLSVGLFRDRTSENSSTGSR
eukprot:958525-Pyramimonas_sp.AAC.1